MKELSWIDYVSLPHVHSSLVSPSLVHRISIVTPSKRWTCDGVTMEYLRKKNGQIAMSFAREMPCSFDKQETKKVPTSEPVGTNIIY